MFLVDLHLIDDDHGSERQPLHSSAGVLHPRLLCQPLTLTTGTFKLTNGHSRANDIDFEGELRCDCRDCGVSCAAQ